MAAEFDLTIKQRFYIEGWFRAIHANTELSGGHRLQPEDMFVFYDIRGKIKLSDKERDKYVKISRQANGQAELFWDEDALQSADILLVELEKDEIKKLLLVSKAAQIQIDDVEWYKPLRKALDAAAD